MQNFRLSRLKKRLISAALLLSFIFLSGCLEQETTGDTTQRAYDRQKEAIAALQPDQNVYGDYMGENADYGRIEARFISVEEPQVGSVQGPLLSIAGRFIFVKRSADPKMKGAPDEALTSNSINFTNGQFDPRTDKIAIVIGADSAILVNCDVESEGGLRCTWIGSHGKSGYELFDLKKVN